jgi:hypothetical protein
MYALVRNNAVVSTWEAIPSRLENWLGFHLMPEAERKTHGFYECVDQRAPLTDGQSYGPSVFAFDGSNVNWTAPVVQPTQDYADAKAAREYAPLAALAAMTPAQIQTYINNNVTDLASAKVALRTLAVAVGVLARRL